MSSGENIVIKEHIFLISKTPTLITNPEVKTESKNGNAKVIYLAREAIEMRQNIVEFLHNVAQH